MLGLFFSFSSEVVGQGVEISSEEDPGPTSANPIPVTFKFQQPVNFFDLDDVIATNGNLNDFFVETPDYPTFPSYNLDAYSLTFSNYESALKRTIISVEINSKGDIFVLTQGNGIKKFSPDGTSQSYPVGGSYFTSPIDLAINSNDEIYVADNSARKIFVFSSDGTAIPSKNRGNGTNGGGRTAFRGPMGLDFDDNDNLFIADRYDGSSTESFERNMVKIYYANGGYYEFYGNSSLDKFNTPYRLALDKRGYLYVSDIGDNNPRVQVFDVRQQGTAFYETTLNTNIIGSPGSIAVDDYGFIYVADFGEDINIIDILSLEESTILSILSILNTVIAGIENNVFNIKVFDSQWDFRGTIEENIDLPLDLALDACGKLFVADVIIKQSTFANYPFDFDLEIYNRLPDSFTAELTIAKECIPATLKIPVGAANNVSCLSTTASNDFQMVWDKTAPVIAGCFRQDLVVESGYELPKFYESEISATENCGGTVSFRQEPFKNSIITQDTPVSIIAIDEAGNESVACTFMVNIEEEDIQTPPVANCNDQTVYLNENGQGQISAQEIYGADPALDGVTLQLMSRNNFDCSDAGSVIPVTVKLTDNQTNLSSECTAEITIIDNTAPLRINCSENKRIFTVAYGETERNVIYEVPEFTDNCDEELTIDIDGPASGEVFPLGETVVTYTATDEFDNSSSCTFTIEVQENTDKEPPVFTNCLNETAYTEPADPGECEAVVNFGAPQATDNSGNVSVELTSELGPGDKFPIGETEVIYTATDEEGNIANCTFTVTVIDDEDPVITTCLAPRTESFDPEVGFTVPNYRDELEIADNCTSEEELRLNSIQNPAAGEVIYETQQISFTVEDASGLSDTCSFQLTLEEEGEESPFAFECQDQNESFDENCEFVLPDYTLALREQFLQAEFTQSPLAGTVVFQSPEITISGVRDGESNSCTFVVIIADTSKPQISCPGAKSATFDPEEGFTIPDYRGELLLLDNCAPEEELGDNVIQTPAPGQIIYESQEISFTVKDAAGNSATCNFLLQLTEEEVLEINCLPDQTEFLDNNCQFVIPDYTVEASVNFSGASITQSPKPGEIITSDTTIVLTASLNGETDVCEFKIFVEEDMEAPDANCISTGVFELQQTGSLTLTEDQIEFNSTDNCGIADFTIDKTEFTAADLGENVITLTVTDTAGNIDSCQTTITIVPNKNSGPDFTCVSQITLELDASGNAALAPADLYTGDPGNRNFTNSKENFDCSNIGLNTITLTYTGSDGSGSCEINVEVVDNISPVLIAKDISLDLSGSGQINISPQLINDGSYDNCGELSFSLSNSVFSCKDLGENVTTLIGEDGNGNITTITATVTITGNCRVIPENPIDHIYIYPNPTPGPFTFAVPQGWIIEKAEVYDSRGRYLTTKVFEGRSSYSMDLTGLQDAVYVMLLYTNEGEKILRVIIN